MTLFIQMPLNSVEKSEHDCDLCYDTGIIEFYEEDKLHEIPCHCHYGEGK